MGATTAQYVFDIAMGLIDEVNENSGATDTADTKEYKVRTLLILNALRGEVYPYSDTYRESTDGSRPIADIITDFTTPVNLDDYICQSVLPYGLAAQLIKDENPATASFLQQKYEENVKTLMLRGMPGSFAQIEDVYGIRGNDEFSGW